MRHMHVKNHTMYATTHDRMTPRRTMYILGGIILTVLAVWGAIQLVDWLINSVIS